MNERRLNGRDVLAKTFPAKTKKGYDPVEVDAYLELVAAQIDLLHNDIEATGGDGQVATADQSPVVGAVETDSSMAVEQLQAQLDEATAARDALETRLTEELQAGDILRAENEQLRLQLTAVAPPPPMSSDVVTTAVVVDEEPEDISADLVPSASEELVVDDRAAQESYAIVLRAAQRTAQEAISEAHVRADEIVADADLTASRIAQESDRKAYEAANRAHKELTEVKAEVDTQHIALQQLSGEAAARRAELRALGQSILQWAEQDDIVADLRESNVEASSVAGDTEA